MNGNGYVGAVRDSVDSSGSADDASDSTRNHTVEGANHHHQVNNVAEGMGAQRIEDVNLANDKLCEAVEEVELQHCGGIESSAE